MPCRWPGWPSPSHPRAGDLQNPRARAERRSGPAPPARPILRHPTIAALPHDLALPDARPARLRGGRPRAVRLSADARPPSGWRAARGGDTRSMPDRRGPPRAAAAGTAPALGASPTRRLLVVTAAAVLVLASVPPVTATVPSPPSPRRGLPGRPRRPLGRGLIPLGLAGSVDSSVGGRRNSGLRDSVSVNRAAVPGGVARVQVWHIPCHPV